MSHVPLQTLQQRRVDDSHQRATPRRADAAYSTTQQHASSTTSVQDEAYASATPEFPADLLVREVRLQVQVPEGTAGASATEVRPGRVVRVLLSQVLHQGGSAESLSRGAPEHTEHIQHVVDQRAAR